MRVAVVWSKGGSTAPTAPERQLPRQECRLVISSDNDSENAINDVLTLLTNKIFYCLKA